MTLPPELSKKITVRCWSCGGDVQAPIGRATQSERGQSPIYCESCRPEERKKNKRRWERERGKRRPSRNYHPEIKHLSNEIPDEMVRQARQMRGMMSILSIAKELGVSDRWVRLVFSGTIRKEVK